MRPLDIVDIAALPRSKSGKPPSSMAPARELAPGTIIDGYRLERQLGHGTEGTVYRAIECLTGVPVALKLLVDQGRPTLQLASRVARICHRLRRSNIVAAYHRSGRADGFVYLVFDHVEGEPLAERLASMNWSADWSADQAFVMLWLLAEKLATAHACRIAFSDFAGGNNIVLIEGENPVFCDFDAGEPAFPNRSYGLDLEVYAGIAATLAVYRHATLTP
ncbi:MAG: hypothetical protein WAS21_01595 [Geminicoccaceae bacterium]